MVCRGVVSALLGVACGSSTAGETDGASSTGGATTGGATTGGATTGDATTGDPTMVDPTTGAMTDAMTDETATSGSTSAATTGGGAVCGDGVVEGGEACEDGNQIDADHCTNACEFARCGDGIRGPGEGCDDGNAVDGDACSNACISVQCGDGEIQEPEDCDEGIETDDCNLNCTESKCGDAIPNAKAGEECDAGGESPTCNDDCTTAACGDGKTNAAAGEVCDEAGESAICDANCSPVVCGDGEVNAAAGEQCDDGGAQAGDGCSPTCSRIAALAVGVEHVCVVTEGGAVQCWGFGGAGTLGYGSGDDLGDQPGELPPPVVEVGDEVIQLSGAIQFSCARLVSGGVRCWGAGSTGQLGYGDTDHRGDQPGEMPTPDVGLDLDALQVAAGGGHTCAIVAGGKVRCWGLGGAGRLGYGNEATLTQPNNLDVPGIAGASQLALGNSHTCALLAGGSVRCWGFGAYATLGNGSGENIGDSPGEMPPAETKVGDPNDPVQQISAGYLHMCAVLKSGKVRCWGFNNRGQTGASFGDDFVGDALVDMPPPDVDLGAPTVQVVAGEQHTCALLATKKVKCWGAATATGYPDLGHIDQADEFPPPDVDLGGDVESIASHMGVLTCALLVDKTVRCWGKNTHGQLGQGGTEPIGDDEAPGSVGPVPL